MLGSLFSAAGSRKYIPCPAIAAGVVRVAPAQNEAGDTDGTDAACRHSDAIIFKCLEGVCGPAAGTKSNNTLLLIIGSSVHVDCDAISKHEKACLMILELFSLTEINGNALLNTVGQRKKAVSTASDTKGALVLGNHLHDDRGILSGLRKNDTPRCLLRAEGPD